MYLGKIRLDVEWRENYRANKGSRETSEMITGVFQEREWWVGGSLEKVKGNSKVKGESV